MKDIVPQNIDKTAFDSDNLWKPVENVSYDTKLEIKTYTKSPMMIVHISRTFVDQKLKTVVIPLLSIKLKENTRTLSLRSIIVHHGDTMQSGHYTCYIRCKKYFYHYDDLNFVNMKFIGDYQKLFAMNEHNVLKNATDFIYF